jgi:hypothetical protein
LKRRNFLKLGSSSALACFTGKVIHAMPFGDTSATAGRQRIPCKWEARKKGKYICDLSLTNTGPFNFTQMFVNGTREVRARFPDVDPSGANRYITAVRVLPFDSIRPDFGDDDKNVIGIEFDPATFSHKRWGTPEEAVLCVRHEGGDVAIAVRSIDYDRNILWCSPESQHSILTPDSVPQFYVENVYEEANAIHEWYLFRDSGVMYYLPPHTLDMDTVVIEMA